ncbi:hypothetical protein BH10PLA1_BH10PLA1_02630 [soil metagenome]
MRAKRFQSRGIAIVIVLVLVALATVMAAALLSSQSIMAQASDNGSRAAQADALADSGIALASYYLQNPTAAPVLNASGFYPGQAGVSLGSAIDGTVDIVVSQVNNSTYSIATTSHYGTTTATPLTRSLAATAAVQYSYVPTDASSVNGSFNVSANTIINGNLTATGTVTLALGSKVNGTITAPSVVGSLLNLIGSIVTTSTCCGTKPAATTAKDYTTYTYNGKTYSAQPVQLGASVSVLGPTSNNPLGVYYGTSDVSITHPLTINGTLLVPNGKLLVSSTSTTADSLTINAAVGMPGLIVKNDIRFNGTKGTTLTVNGLSWIGGVITNNGTTSNNKIAMNGAAQFAGSSAVSSSYVGTVAITYDKTKATVAGFIPGQGTAATGVKLTSFSNSTSVQDKHADESD